MCRRLPTNHATLAQDGGCLHLAGEPFTEDAVKTWIFTKQQGQRLEAARNIQAGADDSEGSLSG